MWRDRRLWLRILTLLLIASSPISALGEQATAPDAGGGLRVRAARRAEKYVDSFSKLAIVPRDRKDVVLYIELDGIGVDEFRQTEALFVFIRPGGNLSLGQRFLRGTDRRAAIVASDTVPKENRRVVVLVPRDTLDFTLHFGGRPPIAFKAGADIASALP